MGTVMAVAFDKALGEAKEEQSKDQVTPAVTEQAPAPEPEPTTEEKDTVVAQPEESTEELLDQETFDKLKSDPEKLRKELNRSYTQKTQELSEQRKQLEPYLEAIQGLSTHPQETLERLAEQLGVKLGKTEAQQEKAAEQVVDKVSAMLSKSFGPGSEELVKILSGAIREAVGEETKDLIAKEVDPIKQQAEQQRLSAVTQEVTQNLEAFGKKHPDWKQYEPKMVELGQVFQPAKNPATGKFPTWDEYMEGLFTMATAGAKKADIVRDTVKRMMDSAAKAEAPGNGIAQTHVAKSAPKFSNFNDAFKQAHEDAKAGVVYE